MHSKSLKTVSCLAAAVMAIAGAGVLPAGTFDSLDISASAADIVESGSCGVNCTYTIDSEGTLTISGTGAMRDYHTSGGTDSTPDAAPWYSAKDSIYKVVVSPGITKIGNGAFSDLTEVTDAVISSSVKKIGSAAFEHCSKLNTVSIPASVTDFGYSPFLSTKWLENMQKLSVLVIVNGVLIDGHIAVGKVTIPEGVTAIGNGAFAKAAEITEVEIPSSVTKIGAQAFDNCDKLKTITIPKTVTEIDHNAYGFYFDSSYRYQAYVDATIYCYKGSAAEEYAKKYNVKYVLLDGAEVKSGDVNGDNSVNNEDLSLMQQKLAGWNLPDFDETAADVTGDGAFNGEDVALFQQKLAGWNVEFKTK